MTKFQREFLNKMNPHPQIPSFPTIFTSSSGNCEDFDQKSKGGQDRWKVKSEEQREIVEDESQPLISLGLGIGIGGSSFCCTRKPDDQVECRNYSVVRFTEEQLEELKRQLLIFKYMTWGLPVPIQLLLPIWKSFSSSSIAHHFDLYRGSSPLLLAIFREAFGYREVMDPEPGRCRRTDGKKWRCHQSVISNQKYCEKHMHRGSKRSRKLVEASPKAGTLNLINLNRNNNPSSDIIRPKFPSNLNQVNGPTRVVMRAPSMTISTAKSNETDKQKNEVKHRAIANERTVVANLASGLDFSPKSVLQNDSSMRCPRVETCKNNPNSESRCKRTDGKKWRCKKEVVPHHKYCVQHINRGKVRSEKPSLGSASSTSREAQVAYGSTSRSNDKFSGTEQSNVGLGLDTNLKISLPTRLAEHSVARHGASSSSSEATESDESSDCSDIIVLSP